MMIQVCGSNFFGQLACPTLRDTVTPCSWTDLESLDVNSIVDVQCCSHCTVVTTKEGLIFICGSINSKIYPSFVFVETSLPLKCVQVACGRKHILALMTGGYVLAWGSGYLGQLGLGDDMSWDTPQLVRGLDPQRLGGPVTRVFCGGYHSGALAGSRGLVFMWGANRLSQCGLSGAAAGEAVIMEPSLVDVSGVEGEVREVCCGRGHSIILTNEGRVYSWGASSYGRLGLTLPATHKTKPVRRPTEIPFFNTHRLGALACGDFHNVGVGLQGGVFAWGYGAEGQIGVGSVINQRSPMRVEALDDLVIVRVACGPSYCTALSQEGALFAWGHADGGWLATHSPPQGHVSMTYADADDPSSISQAGVSQYSSPALRPTMSYSFESNLNVLTPLRIEAFMGAAVSAVSCGGDFMVIVSTPAAGGMESPLERVSRRPTLQLSEEVASLCRHGKRVELQDYIADEYGRGALNLDNTMLIISTQNNQLALCKYLVELGADLNARNAKGNTALHFSVTYDMLELSRFLVSMGADEYATNSDGLTCYEGLSLDDLENL